MSIKMSKKEYDIWRNDHIHENQYEIFHKKDDQIIIDFRFWAKSQQDALDELELFKQKQQLISPLNNIEYFYREINNFIVQHDADTYIIGNNLSDTFNFDNKETIIEKIKDFIRLIKWKVHDIKIILQDIIFWFGHYNPKTNHSEELADSYSVQHTVLRKLLFNIPRMIKSLHGCPSIYTAEAIVNSRKNITITQAYSMQTTNEEMNIAIDAWKADLNKLLLYIRLFLYYESHGIIDENDHEMILIDKNYKKTLPIKTGTDNELDYIKCEELTQKYWDLYCDHWKKIGRMCWD
jgi:hypothetical protein